MPKKGQKHSKETIEKIRLSNIGWHHTEEAKRRMSMARKGGRLSEEHKRKISLALKGRKKPPRSEEHRRRIGLANTGKVGYWLGKKRSRNVIEALAAANKLRTPWNKGLKGFMAGEKNGKWIKDRSLLKRRDERNDPAYRCWSRDVKRRDNWQCKINNKSCDGKVVAHHILTWKDHPELRYEINNGITLCHAHHPRRRAEEQLLAPTFQELISQMQ